MAAEETPPEEPQIVPSAWWVLTFAAWSAVLASAGEITIIAIQRYALGRFVLVGERVLWMSPLANLLVFLFVGVCLLAMRRVIPRVGHLRGLALVYAAVALTAGGLHNQRIHILAALTLNIGIAVQLSRLLVSRAELFQRVVRRTTPALLAAVVVVGVAVELYGPTRERRALAALPPSSPGAPNVLLIVMDTARAQNMSVYGYERETTPHLKQMAAAGARFDLALATSCWTLPSHASMFTGRYPDQLSANWSTALDERDPLLAERLALRGYRRGGFVANFFYCNREMGLARGFSRYQDYAICPGEVLYSASITRVLANSAPARRAFGHRFSLGYQRAEDINRAFLDWLDESGSDRPFFGFLNYIDAHHPCYPPAPFAERFARDGVAQDPERWWFSDRFCHVRSPKEKPYSPAELSAMEAAYDGAIAYVDHCIGALLAELERRGKLDNTVVIVTSDHGEHFGEHGLYNHGVSLHVQETHVPLLIRHPPTVPGGTVVRDAVTLRDLASTVLDLVGGSRSTSPELPGRSLRRRWQPGAGQSSAESPLLSQFDQKARLERGEPSRHDALMFGRWRGLRKPGGRHTVYDLRRDPRERKRLRPDTPRGRMALSTFIDRLKVSLASER